MHQSVPIIKQLSPLANPPTLASEQSDYRDWLHPSLHASFVPLPSKPDVPLTDEQLNALFGGNVESVLRELVRLAVKAKRGEFASAS